MNKTLHYAVFAHEGPVGVDTLIETGTAQGATIFMSNNTTIMSFPDIIFSGLGTFKLGYVFSFEGVCHSIKSDKEILVKPVLSLVYEHSMTWIGLIYMIVTFVLMCLVGRFCRFKNDRISPATESLMGKSDVHLSTETYRKIPRQWWWPFYMTREDLVDKMGEESYFLYVFRLFIGITVSVIAVILLCVLLPVDGVSGTDGDLARFSPASIPAETPRLLWAHVAMAVFLFLILIAFGFISRFVIPVLKVKQLNPADFTVKFAGVHDYDEFRAFLVQTYEESSFQAIYPVYDLEKFKATLKKSPEKTDALKTLSDKVKFTGKVYATFQHSTMAKNCMMRKELFKGLTMKWAEEPADILWRNQAIGRGERWTRIVLLVLFSLFLIWAMNAITTFVTSFNVGMLYTSGFLGEIFGALLRALKLTRDHVDTFANWIIRIAAFLPTIVALLNDIYFFILQSIFTHLI